ncbi:methyltransferase domain-containing protein [Synechococcus sp. J7-Johnson]|uniref:methyltransferase domain-containing protein n=1 Tax=Synechococcus sp. J7-Johnson TaxID=2823737 RepID=UPI0020CD6CB3|nr:methyltransferase domain-containing protein [Synechococcus sp. J7-Johnson]
MTTQDTDLTPNAWDQRYLDGRDGWDLGRAAPPLQHFLHEHPLAPQPPGRVLVPGCGRGHDARLLASLGFTVTGIDISAEALREARRLDQPAASCQWLQVDALDPMALHKEGLAAGSMIGVVEHTCFCAIDPSLREAYANSMGEMVAAGGVVAGPVLVPLPQRRTSVRLSTGAGEPALWGSWIRSRGVGARSTRAAQPG